MPKIHRFQVLFSKMHVGCMFEDIPEGSKPVLIRGGFFASAAEEGLQTYYSSRTMSYCIDFKHRKKSKTNL